jgi:protein-glutamine gamma-glutamyltransferase
MCIALKRFQRWHSSGGSQIDMAAATFAKMVSPNISRSSLAWLLVLQIFIIAPHLLTVPVWLVAVWALVAVWRWQIYKGAWNYPDKIKKTLSAAVCCLGLVVSIGAHLGYESMISLLLTGFILKLLEVKTRRDFVLLVFIALFILSTQFIEYNNMLSALYGLWCLMLICAALMQLYKRSDNVSLRQQLQPNLWLLLQSIPIMLVLFVVVPRLGSFWAVPSPGAAKTGMSDSMSPGDLTQLMQSDELAFRVTFNGAIPSRDKLYWRGLVLSAFDGRRWYVSQRQQWRAAASSNRNKHIAYRGDAISYQVIAEPQGTPWLYSLAAPFEWSDSVIFTRELLIQKAYPLSQRESYSVVSQLNYRLDAIDDRELADNASLPHEGNPETRRVAAQWMAEAGSAEKLMERIFALFNKEFYYTVTPPALGENSVDDFLWRSHQGFCEHFASSFVFFMRAAGIPARVVVGYQGGDLNSVDNYLMVHQRDAHAWAEVWLGERGWVMFDPTAAVAPDRINKGISESLSTKDKQLVGKPFGSSVKVLFMLRERWDALNYQWTRWVMNYDADLQGQLLEKILGEFSPVRMAVWVVGVLSAVLALLALMVVGRLRKPPVSDERKLYQQICTKLSGAGFKPLAGEPPRQFFLRVAAIRPDLASSLLHIANLFDAMAYGNDAVAKAKLVSSIAGLRKVKRSSPQKYRGK